MAKIRKGFVSNSSSSSFICDVCGYEASGFGMSLYEAEMFECENGHTCCEEHLLSDNITPELIQKLYNRLINYEKGYVTEEEIKEYCKEHEIDINNLTFDNIEELYEEFSDPIIYNIPEELCPLCNFEELCMDDAENYLLKTTQYTKEEVFEYIKSINKRRKKLRPHEYVEYVCGKLGITTTELLKQIEERFEGSYSKFRQFLNS